MNSAATVKASPTGGSNSMSNLLMLPNNRHSENITIWSHITSSLLETWLQSDAQQPDKKLLIIDSRSVNEYNQMHIRNSINLSNTKIIKRRLLSDKISIIELLIKNSLADFLIDNKHECNIVVYDHQSEHTNQLDQTESFAPILLNKLTQKFKSVSFLIGGFVNFFSKHPHLCERSTVNVYHSLSMDISPSSAACSSSEFSSPSTSNDDVLFLRPKLNQSLSTHESSTFTNNSSSNLTQQAASRSDLFQFLSPITQTNENVLREPTKILDFLYLGSQEDSLSEKTMRALKITNVLNVSIQCPKPDFIEDSHFLRIPLNDGHAAKILPFFDVAYRFIEKCRKANSNVLIHCLAGISRSPTLAIAYLMKHRKLKSDEAYEYVKERRPTISPNFNFLGQLYEYEKIQQQQQQQQEQNKQLDTTNTTAISISAANESSTTTTTSTTNTTTTTSITSTAPSLPFLKFAKKQQSAINFFDVTSSSSSFESNKLQRKKQFVFQFNSNTDTQENISSPQQQQQQQQTLVKPNLTFSQSSHCASLLPSPSQAFSNFNLNSPSTQSANKTILNSFENSSLSCASSSSSMPKSFTTNNIHEYQHHMENRVVMRRPTNLQMENKSQTTNNLKRPSSILLETNNNINNCANSSNDITLTSLNATSNTNNNNNNNNLTRPILSGATAAANVSPSTAPSSRTQLNSISSTSSSCSSSASSSSASSSLISTLISSQSIQQQQQHDQQLQQQQHQQQSQQQKKIKLSPIQDRNILNLLNNNDLIPGCLNKQQKLEDLEISKEQQEQAQTPVFFRAKFSLTPKSDATKMNESKSLDTIRTLLESPTYSDNKSLEIDDDDVLDDDDSLNSNMKTDELCAAAAAAASSNVLIKSSSNSSSSKPGSNKNSLHGSIEKMIEVS